MKQFLLHLVVFMSVLGVTILLFVNFANFSSDPYYLKISSDRSSNLILGTSKSAQGIQPAILEESLGQPFLNFSFSINSSPYGETYLNSVKNKIDTSSSLNIFILAVDSWSVSSMNEQPNQSSKFRENNSFLAQYNTSNSNINYLTNHFEGKYYNVLFGKSNVELHHDGWLEVGLSMSKEEIERRTAFTLNNYKGKLDQFYYSSLRVHYLQLTIEFLKKYGKVYLVRLPIHPELMQIENLLIPNFKEKIQQAINTSDNYLDLTDRNLDFAYTDGVHLTKESGATVTRLIADWIIQVE